MEAAGAQVLAISPDPNQRSQELADKLQVGYRFLADTDLAVTRQLGLVHPHGGEDGKDVPVPATVVIDRAGVVRWARYARNFQVRPDPGDVVRAVKSL